MTQQLRRAIIVEVLGEEISIDVTYRLIEFIERAFETSAEQCISLFVRNGGVQRRRAADVIADAVLRVHPSKWTREAIRESVITSEIDTFKRNVAGLEAALIFTLKMVDDETFDVGMTELADSRKKKPATSSATSAAAASSAPATA